MALTTQTVREWHDRFRRYFETVAEVHPPRQSVDLDELADMFHCIVDGGIIMSKALNDPRRLASQIMAFRNYIKLLFSPAVEAAQALPKAA